MEASSSHCPILSDGHKHDFHEQMRLVRQYLQRLPRLSLDLAQVARQEGTHSIQNTFYTLTWRRLRVRKASVADRRCSSPVVGKIVKGDTR
jgi:hypothetical protein